MAGDIQVGATALVMDEKDDVATAIKELQPNETISYTIAANTYELTVLEAIPFGHKVAITDIAEGQQVRKYGEVIGRSVTAIAKGRHVHVHNVEGIRGRGDRAKNEGGARA